MIERLPATARALRVEKIKDERAILRRTSRTRLKPAGTQRSRHDQIFFFFCPFCRAAEPAATAARNFKFILSNGAT